MHSLNLLIITVAVLVSPAFSANLNVIRGHPIVETLKLNGFGPYRFLVDTGASMNQVDARIARTLGLTPSFHATIETAAGKIAVMGSKGIEVRLGDTVASGQEFLFTTLEAVRSISPEIQGVLGQEFLSHFDYLLDLHAHHLVFGAQERHGQRCELKFVDRLPVIVTSLGNLVLDSGANRLFVFSARSIAPETSVVTASGLTFGEMSPARRLRIGGQSYGPVETVAVASVEQSVINGLLPLSIFQSVYVSSSGQYAVLK
jgi:predicted aspartyl protease